MGEAPKTESEMQVEMAIDAKRRADNCMIDIKNAEKRWNCRIDPMMQISGQGIASSYRVVPLTILKV